MKLKIFTIFDSKIQSHNRPFFAHHSGEALRELENAVADPNTTICKYPGDFTLFELGVYDDQTAQIEMLPTPISLGLATEFVKPTTDHAPTLPGLEQKRPNPLQRRQA